MRTKMTATMMLMGTVMIAQAAGAGAALRGGQRPMPSPISIYSMFGLTHAINAPKTFDDVHIEKLPAQAPRGSAATIQILVEPRALSSFAYRARLMVNGEPTSEHRIAPRSAAILEALVPADGEVHAMCVSVERLSESGAATQAASRCFDVVVQAGGMD